MKKLILLFALYFTISGIVGCGPRKTKEEVYKPKVFSENHKQSNITMVEVVENYIKAISDNNKDQVLALLSGEALQTTQLNYSRNSNNQSKLEDYDIHIVTIDDNNSFSIIDSKTIFSTDNTLNEQSYRFYLSKYSGVWKIFKVEPVNPDPPEKITTGPVSNDIKTVVEQYLKASMTDRSGSETQFLTGPALAAQNKFLAAYGNAKINATYSNLTVSNVGGSPGYYLLRATYLLNREGDRPGTFIKEKRSVLFEVIRIKDIWRINRVMVEEVEPIE